jgi:serine/threonine protein kinase
MTERSKCRHCGVEIRREAPFGHCDKCLLELGFEESSSEARSSPVLAEAGSFGDYKLLEVIGRGGMGLVYKARQKSLNRLVALKTVRTDLRSPVLLRRFQVEAEAAANLEHPNIVPIYEVGEHAGLQYLTMKFIEGHSLSELIMRSALPHPAETAEAKPGRKAQITAAEIMAKVGRAVHYAHQHGVLHRDLKPSNILLDGQGTPYLTDFGVAKIVDRTLDITESGAVLGTPSYMAPEQAAGKTRSLTTAADIYSLGAILYELLTGSPPFGGQTPVEVLRKVIENEPRQPQTLNKLADPNLATVCLKCLAKDPRQRYGSADAFAEDLERWLRGDPILARRASLTVILRRWARNNPALTTAGVGLILFVVSSVVVLSVKYRDEREKAHLLGVNLQIAQEKEKTRQRWKASLTEDLSALTRDPNPRPVRVRSEERALLAGTGLEPLPAGKIPVRLTFGVYQHLEPITMVDAFHPILAYLEKTLTKDLGAPIVIDFIIYATYELGEAALAHGEVQFMRVGPATYVLAHNENPALMLLAGQTHKDFRGAIVTRANSPIKTAADLKGKHSFAFGSKNSTATLMAKAKLADLGIHRTDFSTNVYRRNHDDVIKAVLDEGFGAGAAKESVTRNPALTNIVTFPIVGMPWVATTNLQPRIAKSITRNLLLLQDAKILTLIEDDLIGFTSTSDRDYEPIRSIIAAALRFDGQ